MATRSGSVAAPSPSRARSTRTRPTAPIYHKSRLLYGLHWAKGEVVARSDVVICEGYTDVMAFMLAGVPNVVATCGTALADEHFMLLKNLARRITLAYDADAAGQAAADRCYQWEQRFEVEFRVADSRPGNDPADVWRDDPARARGLRRTARRRSCSSGSIALLAAADTTAASKVGPAPRSGGRARRRNTRTTSYATST